MNRNSGFDKYLEDIRPGLESLNAAPQSIEGRHEQFELKKRIVRTLVGKVMVHKDRSLEITFRLNLLEILGGQGADQVHEAGTYTHIYDSVRGAMITIQL